MISPKILLEGYSQGVFPMADSENGEINWYTADPRGVIDLQDFLIPKRLKRYINNLKYSISVNNYFEKVMRECSKRPNNETTWISEEMIQSYLQLHRLGHAHSVEVIVNNNLVGGLYGVSLKGAFFGESMFKHTSNASKIALYHLIKRLIVKKFQLLDIQMLTPTTEIFGAKEIPKEVYMEKLKRALQKECNFE